MKIHRIAEALGSITRTPSTEKDLQKIMGGCFEAARIPFQREVYTASGPVDFVVADSWAVEVKIKGSSLAVTRQLLRYLTDDRFTVGVIVTTKPFRIPVVESRGKAIHVIELWRQFL